MKPDWKDAPEWANYLAMDGDGQWFWYENRPETGRNYWSHGGTHRPAITLNRNWKDSLEKRPGDSTTSVDV